MPKPTPDQILTRLKDITERTHREVTALLLEAGNGDARGAFDHLVEVSDATRIELERTADGLATLGAELRARMDGQHPGRSSLVRKVRKALGYYG